MGDADASIYLSISTSIFHLHNIVQLSEGFDTYAFHLRNCWDFSIKDAFQGIYVVVIIKISEF